MNVPITVTDPETGEEVRLYAYRTKSGTLAFHRIPVVPETPLIIAQRLRFAEAAMRARGERFGDRPPASEAVARYASGPLPPIAPHIDRAGTLQAKYRSWLGERLPEVEEMVLGSPNVRSRAEERVASRVAERKGIRPPLPGRLPPPPRPAEARFRSVPRPL